jgi:hypothetical protein
MLSMRLLKFVLPVFALLYASAALAQNGYTNTPMTLEAIGRAYMGREITHVMGFEGAEWLERSERVKEEGTDKLLPLLGLKPTDVVADIGAGTGYFSFRMSPLVAKVYAEDIQEEMLEIISARKAKGEGANVVPLLGGIVDPKLPPNALVRALKPGGRIALIEYRGEDPTVPIKDLHKMTEAQAKKEMAVLGLQWVSTDSKTLPWQHVMIFAKAK